MQAGQPNDAPSRVGCWSFSWGLVTEGAWLPTKPYGSDEKTQADLGGLAEVGKRQVRSWDWADAGGDLDPGQSCS